MNGRARYLQFLTTHVGPGLRAIGFRGSGQAYRLADSPGHALVGFQGGRWSDESAYGFTANVAFHSAEGWRKLRQVETWLPNTPSPNVVYPSTAAAAETPAGWWERLGPLTPFNHDHWWGIDATTDPAALAVEVVDAIREYALPALAAAGRPPEVPGDGYSRPCASRFCYEGTR